MKIKKVNRYESNEIKTQSAYKWDVSPVLNSDAMIFNLTYGTRGSGKSNFVLNFIELHNKTWLSGDNTVYFVSPTRDSKVEKYIEDYPDNFIYIDEFTIESLEDTLEVIKLKVEDWKEKKRIYDILIKFVRGGKKGVEPKEFDELETNNYWTGEDWKDFNPDHPPISCLVLDDSASSPMLSSNGKEFKKFFKFALRHRHSPFYCHLFIITQYPKTINRAIRSQANLIIQFSSLNHQNLKMMFEEYSALFNYKMDNYLSVLKELDNYKYTPLMMFYDKEKWVRIGFNKQIEWD